MFKHNTFDPKRSAAIAALLAATALAGCVAVPARQVSYEGELVTAEPPVAQTEVIGVAPAPGYVWIGGYWGWRAGRHVWIGGHWEAPRAGYHWVPHAWVRVDGGWRLRGGYWARG